MNELSGLFPKAGSVWTSRYDVSGLFFYLLDGISLSAKVVSLMSDLAIFFCGCCLCFWFHSEESVA